eukprot:TRINITY_DN9192_c0_g1_i2.p1 TRINITY_DN9192_c0_g1~~TRINITY_DN9192_c0_g1_i2.p1  ORF type:complete len:2619 (+),score=657.97 TRINITY_DN9192_c0_g1_i2:875-7858(+)
MQGTCVCSAHWYTADCNMPCHADAHPTETLRPDGRPAACTHLAHAQCNPATGECECANDAGGHWTGADCSECVTGYWGNMCDRACACSDHGPCDRSTGACQCYNDDVNGHWSGEFCDACADGYVGFDCKSQNVRITRTSDFSVPVRFTMKVTDGGQQLIDDVYRLSYIGGRPLLLFNLTTEAMVDNEDLAASVVGGWIDRQPLREVSDTLAPFGDVASTLAEFGVAVDGVTVTSVDSEPVVYEAGLPLYRAARDLGVMVGWIVASVGGQTITTGAELTTLAEGLLQSGAGVPLSFWSDPGRVFAVTDDDRVHAYRRGVANLRQARIETDLSTGSQAGPGDIRSGASRRAGAAERTRRALSAWGVGRRAVAERRLEPEHAVELNATAWPHPRAASPLNQPLTLVTSVSDTDSDLVYLVWTSPTSRQVHYQRASTMYLIRIVDISAQIGTVSDALLLSSRQLCIVGSNVDPGGQQWELLLFTTTNLRVERLSASFTVPDCATCGVPSRVAASGSNLLFFTLPISGGTKIVKFDMNTKAVLQNNFLRNLRAGTVVTVTELTLDSVAGSGFAFAHTNNLPTTVYKFHEATLLVYGTAQFIQSGSNVERIISADVDARERTLFCLAALGKTVKIIKLNLFALRTFRPNLADTRGGTLITVAGEGFANFGQTCCRFGADKKITVAKAESFDSQTGEIVCKAPPDPTSDATSCGGQPLEISLNGLADNGQCSNERGSWSQNYLTVQRMPTCSIFRVDPVFGTYKGGRLVTLIGTGFVNTPFLRCKWYSRDRVGSPPQHPGQWTDPNDPPYGDAVYASRDQAHLNDPSHPSHNLTYVNSFRVVCRQPPSYLSKATLAPAFVELSLDGQLFSTSKVEYAIYGRPAGLVTSPEEVVLFSELLPNPSSAAEPIVGAVLRSVFVRTVDSSNHELFSADVDDNDKPFQRKVEFSLAAVEPDATSNQAADRGRERAPVELTGVVQQLTTGGQVEFGNLTLIRPPTGIVTGRFVHTTRRFTWNASSWTFASEVLDTWTVELVLRVVPGEEVALTVERQPSNVSNHGTRTALTVQPVLGFLDVADNIVTQPRAALIGVKAEFVAFVWTDPKRFSQGPGGGLPPTTPTANQTGTNNATCESPPGWGHPLGTAASLEDGQTGHGSGYPADPMLWFATDPQAPNPRVPVEAMQRPGLCVCSASTSSMYRSKAYNYSHFPQDSERCLNTRDSVEPIGFVAKFGSVTYRDIRLIGYFGMLYKLKFSVDEPQALKERIRPVWSHWIHNGECQPRTQRFGRVFSDVCVLCPSTAVCNGSTILQPKENHWRATNLTERMYPCGPANACKAATCNTTGCSEPCVDGTQGPLCAACTSGYGKDESWRGLFCRECPNDESHSFLPVVGWSLGIFVIMLALVRVNVGSGSDTSLTPVLLKVFVSFMQMSSLVGEFKRVTSLTEDVRKYLEWQATISTPVIEGVQLDCAAGGGTSQYSYFMGYMLYPGGCVGLSAIVSGFTILAHQLRRLKRQWRVTEQKAARKRVAAARKGLNRNVYGLSGEKEKRGSSDSSLSTTDGSSSDDHMAPRFLALGPTLPLAEDVGDDCDTTESEGSSEDAIAERVRERDEHMVNGRPRTLSSAQAMATPRGRMKMKGPQRRRALRMVGQDLVDMDEFQQTHGIKGKQQARANVRAARSRRRRLERAHQRRRAAQRRASVWTWSKDEKRHWHRRITFTHVFLTCFVVLMHFVHPTLVKECSKLLECTPLHWEDDVPYRWDQTDRPGTPYTRELGRQELRLRADLRIDCMESRHAYYHLLASVFLLGYGFALPVIGFLLLRVLIAKRTFLAAKSLIPFVLQGVRASRWWWEGVALTRKSALIFVVIFVRDEQLQVLMGLWMLTLFLIVQLYLRPYDVILLQHMDCVWQITLIFLMHLLLAANLNVHQFMTETLSAVMLLMQVSTMALFCYYLCWGIVRKTVSTVAAWRVDVSRRTALRMQKIRFRHVFKAAALAERKEKRSQAQKQDIGGVCDVSEELKKASAMRVVTHSAALPSFDEINVRNKVQVLRIPPPEAEAPLPGAPAPVTTHGALADEFADAVRKGEAAIFAVLPKIHDQGEWGAVIERFRVDHPGCHGGDLVGALRDTLSSAVLYKAKRVLLNNDVRLEHNAAGYDSSETDRMSGGHSPQPFDPLAPADALFKCLRAMRPKIDDVCTVLEGLKSQDQWEAVRAAFRTAHPGLYGGDIVSAIEDLGDLNYDRCCVVLMERHITLAPWDAHEVALGLYKAMKGLGTDEDKIYKLLGRVRGEDQWAELIDMFRRKCRAFEGGDLPRALRSELTDGEQQAGGRAAPATSGSCGRL